MYNITESIDQINKTLILGILQYLNCNYSLRIVKFILVSKSLLLYINTIDCNEMIPKQNMNVIKFTL